MSSAYERTIELLTGKRNLVQALAEKLLEKEVRPTGLPGARHEKRACALAGVEQKWLVQAAVSELVLAWTCVLLRCDARPLRGPRLWP